MKIEYDWQCESVSKTECWESELEALALKRLGRFEQFGFSSWDFLQQIKTYAIEGNREGCCWLPKNEIK